MSTATDLLMGGLNLLTDVSGQAASYTSPAGVSTAVTVVPRETVESEESDESGTRRWVSRRDFELPGETQQTLIGLDPTGGGTLSCDGLTWSVERITRRATHSVLHGLRVESIERTGKRYRAP